jgi:hypothetical protein
MKSIVLFAAICAVAVPISAAADTVTFTYMFPSPLLGYINEDGTPAAGVPRIDPNTGDTLNSVTLHAAANVTWSGGASTDINEATYTITVGEFDFTMVAAKEGNGMVGALADITVAPADFSDFVGPGPAPTSVSVSDTGGTAALISSTFQNETVTYNYTPGPPISEPGVPGLGTEFGISNTPLPATLPLFATGLGALGLLGWFRKRKARASLLGAA